MAFTLVIVSFSCTGPIIGTLLVEAAGHSLLAPAIGMLGFSVALALPFSLFAMFPQWLKSAPRSGDWMTSFKVVLAFLELALSLKFLSVADMAYGWGILPRRLFIAIWIACFAGIAVYLLWNIRKVSTPRKIIRAAVILPSFAFAAYLVPGLWGAPVKAISAFAPPMEIEGREVFNDYDEGMAYARQTGKPVIIDFTGYGCVNCRKMEAYVLNNDSVKARLQNYVFIELFVDDKRAVSNQPSAISVGDKNSAIQREQFGSNAQPFFVQLDSDGKKAAEPMVFTTDPAEFINWLKY
jgi:thiol:disulfide interchange protein DsbD